MTKIFNICWKDLNILLRDRAALIFMLAAPLLLSLGMGLVTGSFASAETTGLQDLPVAIVDLDQGQMSQVIVDAFQGEQLEVLFEPTFLADVTAARALVNNDETSAAVIIPAGFTSGIMPDTQTGVTSPVVAIEVYENPARPISAGVVKAVIAELVSRIETGLVSGQIGIESLLVSGRITPDQIPAYTADLQTRLESQSAATSQDLIRVATVATAADEAGAFNVMSYLAPGMALVFLMYTATQGGRSILAERDAGTLPRMLASPTSPAQVLGGKLLAIFMAGVLQVGILVLVSTLSFSLVWGDALGVILLILAAAAAATGWGILLASFVTTQWQASGLGTAMMLLFGILGGSFIPLEGANPVVRFLSSLTPNSWALDGFIILGSGGGLAEIRPQLLALGIMTVTLFIISVLFARRRWSSGFAK